MMKKITSIISGAFLIALGGCALAQNAPKGDAEAARQNVSMCIGCHGLSGYKTAYPVVYSVPMIGGQSPEYLVKSLQAYRAGDRSHPSMTAIAKSLSDKDIADMAAYYGKAK